MTAPTLHDVIADPRRATEVEPAAVPALLAQLSALQLALAARLAAAAESQDGNDRLLTVEEVAALTRQERSWVWRRARRADWKRFVVKPSRKVLLVREAGLRRWLAGRWSS
jgi:hypothetical protein